MVIVFDTNVWISALHFGLKQGPPRRAVMKAAREHTIAICDPIVDEIFRVLTEKFGWNAADVVPAIDAVLPFPLKTAVTGSLRACRDPNDDMVLECALVSGAQVIVTGDKDLLVLDPYRGIRVMTPADFLRDDA